MVDYTLYYWPIPFRGQFVRVVLAHVGASWEEADMSELSALMNEEPSQQLVPFVGPPVLMDHAAQFPTAQTQAILTYLGAKYGLIPENPEGTALTAKIIADANDVLYEMTLHNGAQLWTEKRWDDYRPRLARWMAIYEEHGRRHGLRSESGYLLGTDAPGLADLVAYTLWGVMTSKLPALREVLDSSAPSIAGLSDRIGELSEQVALSERSASEYDDVWCGGQIEASLRAVLGD